MKRPFQTVKRSRRLRDGSYVSCDERISDAEYRRLLADARPELRVDPVALRRDAETLAEFAALAKAGETFAPDYLAGIFQGYADLCGQLAAYGDYL